LARGLLSNLGMTSWRANAHQTACTHHHVQVNHPIGNDQWGGQRQDLSCTYLAHHEPKSAKVSCSYYEQCGQRSHTYRLQRSLMSWSSNFVDIIVFPLGYAKRQNVVCIIEMADQSCWALGVQTSSTTIHPHVKQSKVWFCACFSFCFICSLEPLKQSCWILMKQCTRAIALWDTKMCPKPYLLRNAHFIV